MFRNKRVFRWQAATAMRLGMNYAASLGYIDALLPTTPLVAASAFWQASQRLGRSTRVTISRSLNIISSILTPGANTITPACGMWHHLCHMSHVRLF
jgi:hypothetical protein